ncbi:MAG TPA: hypothetical protein VHK69_00690 [Chitinophagaceae bacterium]|jgi:hypothetical protein|nr:hypothetical protein [Chitinophagaceae bacterium]
MTNLAFTRILKIVDRQWEFNFRKLPGDELLFHGDVTDAKGARILFQMYRDENGSWRARGANLPLWIIAAEDQMGAAIEQALSEPQTGW